MKVLHIIAITIHTAIECSPEVTGGFCPVMVYFHFLSLLFPLFGLDAALVFFMKVIQRSSM